MECCRIQLKLLISKNYLPSEKLAWIYSIKISVLCQISNRIKFPCILDLIWLVDSVLLAVVFLLDLCLICMPNGSIGCSNNNYASREECKKCGQTKDEAAMPALAMPGSSLLTNAHYTGMLQGLYGSQMNSALSGNPAIQSLLPSSSWSSWENNKFGMQSALNYSFTQNSRGQYLFSGNPSELLPAPKDWRYGDWICNCGFHNYSSRTEVGPFACFVKKKCFILF